MTIQGFRTTSNFVTDGRPQHWRAAVLLLTPNGDAPLYALTAGMKSEKVDDPQFNWWEKGMLSRRIALGANLDNTGGTENITVVEKALQFKEGDLILVEESGEILYVAINPTADTTLNVIRAYGDTVATAVDFDGAAVNPNLLCIGSAFEEGSDAPEGRAFDPTKKYNYTQIFRDTFEHTRTASKTRLRTGDDVKEAKRECLENHSKGIERAFFLGERKETTRNSKPLHLTGGIKSFIASDNIKAVASGQLDMETLETYMEGIFKYGSTQKMGFTGNRALTCIQQAVRKNSSYQIFANEKVFGMKVTKLVSPFGELNFKTHPLFNITPGATGGQTYYGMDSTMYVLDQANLRYRYFSGDDTRYEPKLQDNGVDGAKSGFITEAGLEVHHPDTHYLITQLNAGIADT